MRSPRGRTAAAALLLVPLLAVPAAPLAAADARADDPVADPVPDDPAPSGLSLVLDEVAQLPESTTSPPPEDERLVRHNRINGLEEVPDGSGRLAVPDLNGTLYLLDGESHDAAPYLDVAEEFAPDFFNSAGLGQGLAYAAFHPDFADNGTFYTAHVESGDALENEEPDLPAQDGTEYHGVITEWTADDPAAGTFSGESREVLRLGFSGRIHNIQQIGFNPAAEPGGADYGNLYIAAGDGGNSNAEEDLTDPLDLSVPQGKLLRIDPAGEDGAGGGYGVPEDNPFAGDEGSLGEIYAYGMRDPHRFSWDARGSGRLFLAHIGEHTIESVHQIDPGSNLGWPEREGRFTFRPDDRCNLYPPQPGDSGYEYPLAAYDHDPPADWDCSSDLGFAISGGFVYRGESLPELQGKYVFGDIVNGSLYFAEEEQMQRSPGGEDLAPLYELSASTPSGEPVTMQDLAGDERVDLRFGQDAAGELYLLSKANGTIWKVSDVRPFAEGAAGPVPVEGAADPEHWSPVTPDKWEFRDGQVILAEEGDERPGPARPREYAVLDEGPELGSFQLDAEVRIDTPVEESNRDAVVVFGYRDDTHFTYAHLSSDNTIYGHNGIFKVDGADRERIDGQWNASQSQAAPPAITGEDWVQVRVDHRADTGETAVYAGDMDRPVFTTTESAGPGRVGFGSFDNTARVRDLTVQGTPAE
ncbi:PQQ-dependent sugar dehydrogenase [Nocardiopsis coralliicola]